MPTIECDFCGKEFHEKPARIKRAKHHFCSQKCHYSGGLLLEPKTHKICTDCKIDKPISEYYFNIKNGHKVLFSYCKKCDSKRSTAWKKKNIKHAKEYTRKYYLDHQDVMRQQARKSGYKRVYGITIEQRDDILKKQNGICAICKVKLATDTDHNHITGRVRGMLCNTCNTGLGSFQDNPLILLSAVQYLENDGN